MHLIHKEMSSKSNKIKKKTCMISPILLHKLALCLQFFKILYALKPIMALPTNMRSKTNTFLSKIGNTERGCVDYFWKIPQHCLLCNHWLASSIPQLLDTKVHHEGWWPLVEEPIVVAVVWLYWQWEEWFGHCHWHLPQICHHPSIHIEKTAGTSACIPTCNHVSD